MLGLEVSELGHSLTKAAEDLLVNAADHAAAGRVSDARDRVERADRLLVAAERTLKAHREEAA
jgi:chemotaxis regulatin CheY-phosphate phosphatase CheZ